MWDGRGLSGILRASSAYVVRLDGVDFTMGKAVLTGEMRHSIWADMPGYGLRLV